MSSSRIDESAGRAWFPLRASSLVAIIVAVVDATSGANCAIAVKCSRRVVHVEAITALVHVWLSVWVVLPPVLHLVRVLLVDYLEEPFEVAPPLDLRVKLGESQHCGASIGVSFARNARLRALEVERSWISMLIPSRSHGELDRLRARRAVFDLEEQHALTEVLVGLIGIVTHWR
jgi:hypothetical protein